MNLWVFYMIENKGRTYAGVSPDPARRLRQHNGEISGGAKYTTAFGNGWKHFCFVRGFHTKQQALQFEWAVKHCPPRNTGGKTNRLKKLFQILQKDRWTSKACAAPMVELQVELIGCNYALSGDLPSYIKLTTKSDE